MRKAPETVARPIKVGAAVLGDVRPTKSKPRRPFARIGMMAREIEKLVRHRNEPAWTRWVRPMADLLAPSIGVEAFVRHVLVIAPHLTPDAEEIAGTAEAALVDRRYWKATSLGKELGLSREERKALGITTIRAAGMTRTDQAEEKRRRDRDAKAAKRREDGVMTRDEYLSGSVADVARREGVSRQTIYARRRKAAMTVKVDMCVARNSVPIAGEQPVNQGTAGAPQRAPGATEVVPNRQALAALAADALTVPHERVSFDPARRVILVQFRPARPMPPGHDPAPAIGDILAMAGWPIRATAFDGATIEIAIGEAA